MQATLSNIGHIVECRLHCRKREGRRRQGCEGKEYVDYMLHVGGYIYTESYIVGERQVGW